MIEIENKKEVAERIQKHFREIDEELRSLAMQIIKEGREVAPQWEYLQERRERHARELSLNFGIAYGAVNALLNQDGLGSVNMKEGGHYDE